MLTTRDQAKETPPFEVVLVPEWGTEEDDTPLQVRVYPVTTRCRDDFWDAVRGTPVLVRPPAPPTEDAPAIAPTTVNRYRSGHARCILLQGALLNDGKPIFTVAELDLKSPAVIDRLFEVAARLTGGIVDKTSAKEKAKGES